MDKIGLWCPLPRRPQARGHRYREMDYNVRANGQKKIWKKIYRVLTVAM